MKVVFFLKKKLLFPLSLVLSVNLREKKCRKRGKSPEAGRLRSVAAELGLVLRAPGTQRPLAAQPGPALSSWSWCQEKEWVV